MLDIDWNFFRHDLDDFVVSGACIAGVIHGIKKHEWVALVVWSMDRLGKGHRSI